MEGDSRIQAPEYKQKTERFDLSGNHPEQGKAAEYLRQAGRAVKPKDVDYQATAVVHFYKSPLANVFLFLVQQTGLNSIPEGQADKGFKELQRSLMNVYGRKQPKSREEGSGADYKKE